MADRLAVMISRIIYMCIYICVALGKTENIKNSKTAGTK